MPRNGSNGIKSKKERIAAEVARAVGAGRQVAVETVDFNDPNRPKTCLEVDFPILPINQVAADRGQRRQADLSDVEVVGAAALQRVSLDVASPRRRRRPTIAPTPPRLVWDVYYANHQKKGAFKHLKVADIFMGGGTTLVEGSRLGMQMFGIDLNPVAWFVVKQELAQVDIDEVKRLLADIEAEVKPQIMPFYYCDGPNGEKGTWTHMPTGEVMGPDFDPLSLKPEDRRDYSYEGPEIIYTFWAKHGPCQVTGCGHRTPIMTTPVMAVKTLTVKHWPQVCSQCQTAFDVEEAAARMAPDVPLYVAPEEKPFSMLDRRRGAVCPSCGHAAIVNLGKGSNKKVELSLLVHPQWLAGCPGKDENSEPYGGSAQDDAASTARWNEARARAVRLLEVRGPLPETATCPETGVTFNTGKAGGSVPKTGHFACASCGTVQPIVTAIEATGKTAPTAAFAVQGFSSSRKDSGAPYGGRFFAVVTNPAPYSLSVLEWAHRKGADLRGYWPSSEIPFGHMTHQRQPLPAHGYTRWSDLFNSRQLLVHAQLLRAIVTIGKKSQECREYVLGALQQYLRNQSLFTLWNIARDELEPMFANNNYHPKSTVIENGVFASLGRGNWTSCAERIIDGFEWVRDPWEQVSASFVGRIDKPLASLISGKSEKVWPSDAVLGASAVQWSATDLDGIVEKGTVDLVITDPPFGGLLHYSELADFFYVWLRLALKDHYPEIFGSEYSPPDRSRRSGRGGACDATIERRRAARSGGRSSALRGTSRVARIRQEPCRSRA